MARFYASYKPSLDFPSYDDDVFHKEADHSLPDEQEQALMLQLAEAFLNIDPDLGKWGYSPITTRDGSMEKITIRYGNLDHGVLHIYIHKNIIHYTIEWQYGHHLFVVINKCTVVARKMAGYFAYCEDSSDGPYDPLKEEGNVLLQYESVTNHGAQPHLPEDLVNELFEEKAPQKAWWQFWKK